MSNLYLMIMDKYLIVNINHPLGKAYWEDFLRNHLDIKVNINKFK